jgi:hypothetical protein
VALAEGSSGTVALIPPLPLSSLGVGLAALVFESRLFDRRRSLSAERCQQS